MAAGRMRCTRRLRSWMIDQVSSGKYSGLEWDDEAKTMFRIPWKHAGKQDFRKDEDAAIFKAWAEFKGKLTDGGQDNPAIWKTRLRCALNKSPEFQEVMERAQLDISEPYKVYRLVPFSEQGLLLPEEKSRKISPRKLKRRRSSEFESDEEDEVHVKQIKTEEVTSQLCDEKILQQSEIQVPTDEPVQHSTVTIQRDVVDEIQVDVRYEESVPASHEGDSINVALHYLGKEVLKRQILGSDVRITYLPSSLVPPTPSNVLRGRFPRIPLPEPPPTLSAGPELQALQTLLPFMEKGVVLTSTEKGVYGKRYCQGRVFWTGPHTNSGGPHKMERDSDPVLLFSRDAFKQQLDPFCSNGGDPPPCGFTLCFGEELSDSDKPSEKLIIAQITLPWAEQQVQDARTFCNSINFFKSLASQSPLGEITLNLVAVPSPTTPESIMWPSL